MVAKKQEVAAEVNEDLTYTDNDGSGRGSMVPEPVNTGDPHANRPQDNLQGDAAVAHTRGQEISRSAQIAAIMQMLVGMDGADLSQIYDAVYDANQPGAAAAPLEGDQGKNLASISTKEDVEELFAGEELTEDFKSKAQVIFEAAVQARVAIEKTKLEEQNEAKLEESVEELTDVLVGQMDKYLTFAAEQFVEQNKQEVDTTTRSVIAEGFVADVIGLVEKYKIESDPATIETTTKLQEQIEELTKKLNESVDREAAQALVNKELMQKQIFAEATENLTPIQRDRFNQLAESIEFDTADSYKQRLSVIKETFSKKTTPAPAAKESVLSETVIDGVPSADETKVEPTSNDVAVRSVLSALRRHAN